MKRAFSSTSSALVSFFSSSQASQNRMFSSLYSHRRKSRNSVRPAKRISTWMHSIRALNPQQQHVPGLFISLSKLFPHILISSSGGLRTQTRIRLLDLLHIGHPISSRSTYCSPSYCSRSEAAGSRRVCPFSSLLLIAKLLNLRRLDRGECIG